MSDVKDTPCFERVSVKVKISDEVKGGKKKQDVVVKDVTGVCRFTLWEEEVDKVEKEKSYKLGGMVVREFNNRKYLSTALENSSIELIDDIGPVFDTTDDDDETCIQITNGTNVLFLFFPFCLHRTIQRLYIKKDEYCVLFKIRTLTLNL